MIEAPSTIPAGLIKRVHVDQHRIKSNSKSGEDAPVLTVQARGGPYKAHEVSIDGPARIVYDGSVLSCGAKCWIETTAEVTTHLRGESEAAA